MNLPVILMGIAISSILLLAVVMIVVRISRSSQSGKMLSGETKAHGKGMAIGIAIGMAVGFGIGLAMDNMGMGIGIGIAIGVSLGVSFAAALKEKEKKRTYRGKKFQPELEQDRTRLLLIVGLIAVLVGFMVLGVFFYMKMI